MTPTTAQLQKPTLLSLVSILYSPRRTFRQIVDSNPTYGVIPLALLLGTSWILGQLSSRNVGDSLPLTSILVIAGLGGPLTGVILVYVFGGMITWVGARMGGTATPNLIRAAYTWGWVPNLWVLPLWLPKLLLFREELFTSATPRLEASLLLSLVFLGITLVELVAGGWGFIVLLKAIGEAHAFSIWRALFTLVISAVIIVIPYVVVLILSQAIYYGP